MGSAVSSGKDFLKKPINWVFPVLGMNKLLEPKAPDAPTSGETPPPATPLPSPNDPNPQATAAQRARKLSALKYGWQSTITKTPTLASTAGGLKTKLGQ
jgi:hypothetical protein